ncbi:MAG: transaldolase [Burkholderiales bacterium]|nr:transaldolase [Burkholderiales bacterium]
MNNSLLDVNNLGQSIWLDNISNNLIVSGKLQELINIGVTGVTSNPTIFHKAIANEEYYINKLSALKSSITNLEQRYEQLVIPDIQRACDQFIDVYNSSAQKNGYVSFEVSPYLANNKNETITNAKRLWLEINRPNLMIKIPATAAGIEAFEELTAFGINVNITLLFSLKQLTDCWNAYIRGIQQYYNRYKTNKKIKAVASFFLSRIDSAIDSKLPQQLQGKTAINLCKLAYQHYNNLFYSDNFSHLNQIGFMPQFLLFASTGTKNNNYSDVLYIEEVIGAETINTVPDNTLNAFIDHGKARKSLNTNIDSAKSDIEKVNLITNLEQLGDSLQQDGLKLFTQSFDALIDLMK